jgi:hypothetical protein
MAPNLSLALEVTSAELRTEALSVEKTLCVHAWAYDLLFLSFGRMSAKVRAERAAATYMAKCCMRARAPWIMSVSSVHPCCPAPIDALRETSDHWAA